MQDDRNTREAASKIADEAAASASLGGSPSFKLAMLEMASRMRSVIQRREAKKAENQPQKD